MPGVGDWRLFLIQEMEQIGEALPALTSRHETLPVRDRQFDQCSARETRI